MTAVSLSGSVHTICQRRTEGLQSFCVKSLSLIIFITFKLYLCVIHLNSGCLFKMSCFLIISDQLCKHDFEVGDV